MKTVDYLLRNIPEPLHKAIQQAAESKGLSIRAYMLTTLAEASMQATQPN